MGKVVNKLELIKLILKHEDIVLILLENDKFDYRCICNSGMMANLYHRLLEFIPNWKRQWVIKHKIK